MKNRRFATSRPTILACVLGAGAIAGVGGCEVDSWFDPSVVGRWEHTPADVPILKRLASIEGPEDEFVEISEVQASDLMPDVTQYRIGPGDALSVIVWDLITPNVATPLEVQVDQRGIINLPQIGEVSVSGLSVHDAQRAIGNRMIELDLVRDPLVNVTVIGARSGTFTILGAVGGSGPYFIPRADFRLLDAIAGAGGMLESVKEIYIIRQIPLVEEAIVRPGQPAGDPPPRDPQPQDREEFLRTIDEITGERGGGGSPGAFGASSGQPAQNTRSQPNGERQQPAVDLIDPAQPARPAPTQPPAGDESWMYLQGEWVRVQRPARAQPLPGQPGLSDEDLRGIVTQRVIRVAVQPLLAGDGRYNVVIRPGDVVRVPNFPQGRIYLGGNVNRPGAYNMDQDLTLMRVIDAAGGLTAIGIPERVDIVRMTGLDRQGMVRVNLRAINEGTQPDIYLRPNDRINVGTNFWAYPLAVVRNGFRANYGFGFLLDRNFGNDVFGPPPVRRFQDQ